MDAELARGFLLQLPHVVETVQWGDNLVLWIGDKAIGGKMFALINLDGRGPLISFASGAERAAELCEKEGLRPAPYFARLHWVAAERWDALGAREWQEQLRNAHETVFAKLPPRVRQVLHLPPKEQATLVAERRKALAAPAAPAKERGNQVGARKTEPGR